MMRSADNAAAIRPSPGYLYSLSIAAVGLPFTAIALSGALRGRAGGDPMRAMDFDGVIFFLLAFCVGFGCSFGREREPVYAHWFACWSPVSLHWKY
jgi:hypothetical protein